MVGRKTIMLFFLLEFCCAIRQFSRGNFSDYFKSSKSKTHSNRYKRQYSTSFGYFKVGEFNGTRINMTDEYITKHCQLALPIGYSLSPTEYCAMYNISYFKGKRDECSLPEDGKYYYRQTQDSCILITWGECFDIYSIVSSIKGWAGTSTEPRQIDIQYGNFPPRQDIYFDWTTLHIAKINRDSYYVIGNLQDYRIYNALTDQVIIPTSYLAVRLDGAIDHDSLSNFLNVSIPSFGKGGCDVVRSGVLEECDVVLGLVDGRTFGFVFTYAGRHDEYQLFITQYCKQSTDIYEKFVEFIIEHHETLTQTLDFWNTIKRIFATTYLLFSEVYKAFGFILLLSIFTFSYLHDFLLSFGVVVALYSLYLYNYVSPPLVNLSPI